ncbi:SLC13 family permease [Futiania mangrovi]|uniref:SLC13 family permease n=1 Tax=Futiania mangrovi TaxID=2959716 RepID=A0A9J6PJP9_9PROT|nr:SLC13 family permease [Futiania mangrovii]MCP1336767.1 SLC13 family permease [Futiania mangrovii]
MTDEQILILAILGVIAAMFLWGRWRHDMVALGGLIACVAAGLVPGEEAFSGFGHPAVVTVAAILVLSRGLQTSGAVDMLTQRLLPSGSGPVASMAAITLFAAVLSGFMNNVGALALLMPVALQVAAKHGMPPGHILMPLSFGSILGGMTTLIGTPPNLIVAGFRAEAGGQPFGMFDFTPVGLAVAATGLVFILLIGWRLVPARVRAGAEGFDTSAYLTEARVPQGAKADGMTLREVERSLVEAEAQVIGLVRAEVRIPVPSPLQRVRAGDILVIEAEPKALAAALSSLDLKLEEAVKPEGDGETGTENGSEVATSAAAPVEVRADADPGEARPSRAIASEDVVLMELTVLPESALIGRSASDLRLRTRFGINLLAVSRQGRRSMARLRTMALRAGDVLLMQGGPETLIEFANQSGCVPLAERALRLPNRTLALKAGGILLASIAAAVSGLVPAAVAFVGGVLASMALRVVPSRGIYKTIDWPVIVLLGALIPVANAMADTGAADLIARVLMTEVAQGSAILGLAIILVVTMTLSDFMNNAATAAVMCPIAIGTAAQLGHSADPFLMAVAVGASCAFLTPIGHQNNTLILGPGGFRFGDYWRMGLPLEVIVVAVGVPMILLVWPLSG